MKEANGGWIVGVDLAKPERKYEFTGETMETADGHTLQRIRYLRDIRYVKPGTLGGWIEEEVNLSHVGDALVLDDAKVYKSSIVRDSAIVEGSAVVIGASVLWDEARVSRTALIDRSRLGGDAHVGGRASVKDSAISGAILLTDDAHVAHSTLRGSGHIKGHARLDNCYVITEGFLVTDQSHVDNISIKSVFKVIGEARIKSRNDLYVIGPIGSEGGTLTVYKTKSGIGVTRGCFSGTLDEFEAAVKETHGGPGDEDAEHTYNEYTAIIAFIRTMMVR
jgi:hypothetical protein